MNPEENKDDVRIKLLDDKLVEANQQKSLLKLLFSRPKHPFLTKNFEFYNIEKIEWAYRELINMGFTKTQILPIVNDDDMDLHENNTKEMIFNYLLLTILDNPDKSKPQRSESKDNISLLIKSQFGERKIGSQIYQKKEEKIGKTVSKEEKKRNASKGEIKGKERVEENKKEDDEEEKKEEICGICLCPGDKFEIIPKCKHRFCEECFQQYLKSEVEQNSDKLQELPCPENNCKKILKTSFVELKLKGSPILLTKFQKFLKQAKYSKNPSYRHCIKPNCEFFAKKPFFGNKLQCACGQTMCFKCKKEWHEKLDCNQVYDKEKNEQAFQNYQKQMGLKSCPKCQIIMNKYDGCNHITCTKCKYEFCWICFEKWDLVKGLCPKGCEKFPENNNAIHVPPNNNNVVPRNNNLRQYFNSFEYVENIFLRRMDDFGSNFSLNFILLHNHHENFNIFYTLLYFFPYFICQLAGFAITISIFSTVLVVYIYLYLLWVIYTEKLCSSNLNDEDDCTKALKILYFSFNIIYDFACLFVDNLYMCFLVTLPLFWVRYTRWCFIQKNSCFFFAKMNYQILKTFCLILDRKHEIYRKYGHGVMLKNSSRNFDDNDDFCSFCLIWTMLRGFVVMCFAGMAVAINKSQTK